jgi:hypothetical protein
MNEGLKNAEVYPLPLYIMDSILEAKEENIWVEPIVLGLF